MTDAATFDDHDDRSDPIDLDWVRALLDGLPDEVLEETMESPDFVGELRHYQRRGLSWMQFLAKLGLGGCLADDMGLGKTATTLAHLVERPGPHLVVCPLSVVRNWSSEAQRFTPKLDVQVHHGSTRSRVRRARRRATTRSSRATRNGRSSSRPTGCCHATSNISAASSGRPWCSTRRRW